jgi:hypothetical protein
MQPVHGLLATAKVSVSSAPRRQVRSDSPTLLSSMTSKKNQRVINR